MNEIIKHTGGMPLTVEDLIFMQDSYKEAFAGVFSYIDDCKLKGCDVTVTDVGGGNNQYDITEGFIWLDREVLYVPAHSVTGPSSQYAFFTIEETLTRSKTFYDSTTKSVGAVRVAKLYVSGVHPAVYLSFQSDDAIEKLKGRLGISPSVNDYTSSTLYGDVEGSVARQWFMKHVVVSGVMRDPTVSGSSEKLGFQFGYHGPGIDVIAPLVNATGGVNGYVKMYTGNSNLYYSRATGELGDHYFNFSYML